MSNNKLKKIPMAIKMMWTYRRARRIIRRHYDMAYIADSKYAQGGRHGKWTAPVWEWVVRDYVSCKRMRVNQDVPWPVSPRIAIVQPQNITFHPDDLNNFQTFGNYFQAIGEIRIGRGTFIAPNVGIITANHDPSDLQNHAEAKPVVLGEACWIGMNSMILPGVTLGDHTVVGAGSVVTKSFPEGNCVIAGNPARKIKDIKNEVTL